ncbi:LutC/YkgG family protein [Aestuariivivens sediminis]|uniref:LutC/YkgG family protein n=1 Tax=Aestuariivivens sediminis TaxID=2913557 RepID=UPI001F58717C|nr:LUD domain-containing protein [Aestuariivivens sediminis]
MDSRSQILTKIKANKPEPMDLLHIDPSIFDEGLDVVPAFTKTLEAVGGNVCPIDSMEAVHSKLKTLLPNARFTHSTLENTHEINTFSFDAIERPHDLEDLDILMVKSDLAVAENGAVWIDDSKFPIRVLPFITKHLVFVIEEKAIVPYMHQAYEKIRDFNFGVFISGPSKTADIEQALVIGAQGALSLTVLLLTADTTP